MSRPHQPQLPPELLDYIVDHLHDSTEDLHSCCLISKSWIPRIRSRIFACVKFYKESLESWESTFPDPSTSPASYTKSLLICCDRVVIGGNAEEGGWISSFSSVVRLDIMGLGLSSSPVSLHGFSPVLKSLNLCRSSIWPSQILNLICSFPLLEDVTVESFGGPSKDDDFDGQPDLIPPRGSPALTGSLDLYMCEGIGSISSGLLSLPSGLHFRKLVLALHHEEDVSLITALVDGCCSTLEFLKVDCSALDPLMIGQISLHKATALKHVVLTSVSRLQWVVTALQTIRNDHRALQRITLFIPPLLYRRIPSDPASSGDAIGATMFDEWSEKWSELDRLLVRLWWSHSARLGIGYCEPSQMSTARAWAGIIFPDMTARGVVDPIEIVE